MKVLVGGGNPPPMFEMDSLPKEGDRIFLTAAQALSEMSQESWTLVGRRLRVVATSLANIGGKNIPWIGIKGNAPKPHPF